MGIVRNAEPTTEYEKELHKWNTPKRLGGFNTDGAEQFPMMVYKAHRRENGKVMCLDMEALYAADMNVQLRAEAFNKTCTRIVNSPGEFDRARSDGWAESPAEALEYHEMHARAMAQAAAEAAYTVQNMSAKAKKEFAAADAATEEPLADVPAPKKAAKGTRVEVK
jgi:hypothetical protein